MILWVLPLIVCLCCRLVVGLDDSDTQEHWDTFKERYNKEYDSPEDEEKARDNFETNLLHVALHNMKDEHSYDKDVNEFSDMSLNEMSKNLFNTDIPDDFENQPCKNFSTSKRNLPSSLDWTKAGKVTPVKNQNPCGSCWAFSAAQAIESAYAMIHTKLVILSEQQLIDCSANYGNHGCHGGSPMNAYEYIKAAGGIVSEQCDPYQAEESDMCTVDDRCQRYKITGYINVGPRGDEQAVLNALAKVGPLSIALYVSDHFKQFSGSDVFIDHTYEDQKVNHGVLLTGYGTQDGQDYWLIKNSWGMSWGDGGYMKVARNYGNHLKIASYATFPLVE